MAVNKRILITFSLLLALSSDASAFFFSWGAEPTTQSPVRYYYYQKRLLQGSAPFYNQDPPPPPPENNNIQLPAIPVQVPLQAQLSPSTVQNVQLVPCLCPVSQDYNTVDNPIMMDNIYMNPLQGHDKKTRK